MHYVFLDEKYIEEPDHRSIVVAAWAVNQNTLNNHPEQLTLPTKAPFLQRVESAFENLNALAYVGRARLPKSVFRTGEVDGCDDVPRMARTNTVWSMAMMFAVGRVLFDVGRTGHLINVADLYFDPKSLTEEHRLAWEGSFRSLLAGEARRFGMQAGLRSLEELRIRRIEFVQKAKDGNTNKFQHGVELADKLCSRSDGIFRSSLSRISHGDMSQVIERTVGQFDGIPFYEVR